MIRTDFRVLIQLKESGGYATPEISLLTYVNLSGSAITLSEMREALRSWEAQGCVVSIAEEQGRSKVTMWSITPTGLAKLAEKAL